MGIGLKTCIDGLVHTVTFADRDQLSSRGMDYRAACRATLPNILERHDATKPTCVACVAGVARCFCGDTSRLAWCPQVTKKRDRAASNPCACCDEHRRECEENAD